MEWELLRIGLKAPHQQESQKFIEDLYRRKYGEYISIKWSGKTAIVINTNCIHRAGTFSLTSQYGATRHFVSFEFMDPTASHICSKLKLGRCRSSLLPEFHTRLTEAIFK
jgi:hypothetical protein